jgi:guanosine-3',5'-bis(diphosphate) 3'-pyrophosphohydrolase
MNLDGNTVRSEKMTDLDIAKHIAEVAHKNQKRKNGEDYINHCVRVSKEAEKISLDAAIVGMLHDVIEDSNIDYRDIKEFYGLNNEDIIAALHRISKDKNDSYLQYILKIKNPVFDYEKLAYQVKLLDLKDNLNGATGTLKDKYQLAYYILTGEDIS